MKGIWVNEPCRILCRCKMMLERSHGGVAWGTLVHPLPDKVRLLVTDYRIQAILYVWLLPPVREVCEISPKRSLAHLSVLLGGLA